MPQRVWLITGCSSGLGRLFVPAIVARGDRVIATARDTATLAEFETDEENISVLQLDITASQDILDCKIQEALRAFGRIDVLVNNAGYVGSGVWEEVSHEDTVRQFATNFFGAMNLTRSVLPHFRERRSGTLVFMSSIAAWIGVGAGGLYSSSKFALEGAVESLQRETAHIGIETYLMILGQFRTGIIGAKSRDQWRLRGGISEYTQISEGLAARHRETDGKQPGDPQRAVDGILDVVRHEGSFQHPPTKELPLRIPLGSDAVEVMRAKCNETLQMLSQYEGFARSTDYDGVQGVAGYGSG